MKLSRRGPLAWWAFLPDRLLGVSVPYQSSVCALFWRSVVLVPALAALALITSPVSLAVFGVIYGTRAAAWLLMRGVGAIPNSVGDRIRDAASKVGDGFNLVFEFFRAVKARACPLVRFE